MGYISNNEMLKGLLDQMEESHRRQDSIDAYKAELADQTTEVCTSQPGFDPEPVLTSFPSGTGRDAALSQMLYTMKGWN